MYWSVPKIWEGGCVWIIGGGPSIQTLFNIPEDVVRKVKDGELQETAYSPYMKAIHNEHIIGINAAFLMGKWIDVVFFGDSKFFLKFRNQLKDFNRLKVSCAQAALKHHWIHSLRRDRKKKKGISTDPTSVSWCGNSGCAAISMAYNAGVKRVFLLGFDMKLGDDRSQHWHSQYKEVRTSKNPLERKNLPFNKHLPAFPMIARDAERLGLEIYNVSPDSVIDVFPKITLERALELAKDIPEEIRQITDVDFPSPVVSTNKKVDVRQNIRKRTTLSEGKIPYGLNEDLAGAYNKAMLEANSDWVILMDHDVFPSCNPHWYEMCLEAVKCAEDDVGLITCVCNPRIDGKEDPDKTSQRPDISLMSTDIHEHINVAKKLYGKYGMETREIKSEKVAGFFMIVNKKIWEKIRFVDVGRGVRKVDWTYCSKLLKRGYKILEMPGLYVYHHRGVRTLKWAENNVEFSKEIRHYMIHPYPEYPYGILIDKHFVKGVVRDVVDVAEEYAYLTTPRQVEEFNFNTLPDSFVIKATHGSGWIKIFDKSYKSNNSIINFNRNEVTSWMKERLSKKYCPKIEKFYNRVKPGIIIEENLSTVKDSAVGTMNSYPVQSYTKEVIDYKFYCFGGEIGFIFVNKGHEDNESRLQNYYDLDWNETPFVRKETFTIHNFPKPKNLKEMITKVRKLLNIVKNPPFVRIDLYNIEGRIYFGEFTYAPAKGKNTLVPRNANESNPNKYERKFGRMMYSSKLTVLCFKWNYTEGFKLPSIDKIGGYTAEHVNKLFYAVKRNLTIPHRFVCITNEPEGIECETIPLWNWGSKFGGCYKRLKLFDPNIKSIVGDRFAMVDLDTVITGNLDDLFTKDEDFVIHTYYRGEYEQVYNGGLWLMTTGSRPQVYNRWKGQESVDLLAKLKEQKKYIGTDQAWINYVLGNNEARFSTEHGVYEYRKLQKKLPMKMKPRISQLPDDAVMVLFSGTRDPILLEGKCDWINEHWV
jgi:GT2 family glycosyltransferase